MPPKAADSKPKPEKAKKIVLPPDEYDEMDITQLQNELRKATQKLNETRRVRNYFQLEKDQVQQFYDIVREEVEKTRSHVRNVEAQLERMQDTHANDLKVYLQRVVHLEYEHTANIEAIQAAGEKERLEEQQSHLSKLTSLSRLRSDLEAALQQQDAQHADEMRSMRDTERKEVSKLREKFERQHQNLKERYEERLKGMRDDLDIYCRLSLHEVGERQNSHLNTLIWNHESKVEEMRAYYQAITKDNITLIDALQEQIKALKAKHAENESALSVLEQENKLVSIPVRESKAEVQVLTSKLATMSHYRQALSLLKDRRARLSKDMATLIDNHRSLVHEHANVVKQRDMLCDAFEKVVLASQEEASEKTEAYERELQELQDMYRNRNAQFGAILRASTLEPHVLQSVTRKLDDVLTAKNEQMEELRYEVCKAQKTHNDMVRVYEARLMALGVDMSDEKRAEREKEGGLLGLVSKNTVPAGLVTK